MQTQNQCDQAPETAEERPLTNPSLTANLRGDYEALKNDVEQAKVLAADFQQQLAGKSNEVAHLKQVFEKTSRDLANLQTGITALREERHRLANEAMRAVALEHRLKKAEAEIARLKAEGEKASQREHARESQIAQLTGELEKVRQQLTEAQAQAVQVTPLPPRAPASVRPGSSDAKALLAEATETLERLRELVKEEDGGTIPAVTRRASSRSAPAQDNFIDISFDR
jgi:chromosome segregation ATPase